MRALGWADAAWVVGIAAASVATFFIFLTPEPARTAVELVDLLCERSPDRSAAIARHVAEPLELSLPEDEVNEAERQMSRGDIAEELDKLDLYFPRCSFALEDWQIRSAGAGAAWVEGMLESSESQPSDLHAKRRTVRALFREVDGEQRLERVVLGPFERRVPEARP